jgi:hypothetical protein
VALEAQAAGMEGMVIWGLHRDTADIRAIGAAAMVDEAAVRPRTVSCQVRGGPAMGPPRADQSRGFRRSVPGRRYPWAISGRSARCHLRRSSCCTRYRGFLCR